MILKLLVQYHKVSGNKRHGNKSNRQTFISENGWYRTRDERKSIVQNGKVIGAVTHVFVNDPTSGYGVHIEWMLHEAGINIYDQEEKAS